MASRNWRAALAAVALVAVVALWALWVRHSPSPPLQTTTTPAPLAARDPTRSSPPSRSVEGAAALAAGVALAELPPEAAEAREAPAVLAPPPPLPSAPPPYPPGSQPITEAVDPAAGEREDVPVDPDRGVHAVFGARRDVVHPPEPLVVDLAVLDARGRRLAVGHPLARFRGDGSTPDGPWFAAPFVDDGALAYSAALVPDAAARDALLGFQVFVEVSFDAPDGAGARRYVTSLHYTPLPAAHLDGRWRDALEGGSLIVYAGVTVDEPGQYKVIGSLFAGAAAIAFAQTSLALDAGAKKIPLTFFGRILAERGLDGPYALRDVMLLEELPRRGTYRPGVTIEDAYLTRPYAARAFSTAPWTPPPLAGPIVTADSPSQQDRPPPRFQRTPRPAAAIPTNTAAP